MIVFFAVRDKWTMSKMYVISELMAATFHNSVYLITYHVLFPPLSRSIAIRNILDSHFFDNVMVW